MYIRCGRPLDRMESGEPERVMPTANEIADSCFELDGSHQPLSAAVA